MKTCDTCKYYEEKETNKKKKVGRCKRHSPVAGFGFPTTFPTSGCGDHKLDENKI